jgi:hypothetical protein
MAHETRKVQSNANDIGPSLYHYLALQLGLDLYFAIFFAKFRGVFQD